MMVRRILGALLFFAAPAFAAAVEVDSVLVPETAVRKVEVRALRLAERSGVEPLAVLQEASVAAREGLEAIAAWNRAGRRPVKDGFARPLAIPRAVRFTGDLLVRQPGKLAGGALLLPPSGGLVWGSEVQVEGSYRLRLHLSDVRLPPGTRMWVYGEDGEEAAFEAGQVTHDGEIWTPSVGGPVIRMEVQLPEGEVEGYGFTVDQVLEQVALDVDGVPRPGGPAPKEEDTSCVSSASCFGAETLPTMDLYKKAVAHLRYVAGGSSFLCSGALMNDVDPSTFIPYLLTANHCFSTQAVASTLEAFFDFIIQGCPGSTPSLGSRPRTVGSTLLATNASTDFTLVRLSSIPAERGLLGWTTEAVPAGTMLYRLSHPHGFPMAFSTTSAVTTGPACGDTPRPRFLYSGAVSGGVLGGSSGAPVVRPDGRVVGQLLGTCGPTLEGCDTRNSTVDGAFSQTFASVAPFLNTPAPTVCTPGPSTLCLGSGGRFKVEATFDTGSQQGQAQVVKLTEETGYLWFFNSANVEAVVKVVNGCSLNQRFWIFAGGLTDVRTVIAVTDTKTGFLRTYTNPRGTPFQPIQDTDALPTCP